MSEFFAGKRPLSTNQIKALRDLRGIPADLLLEVSAKKSRGVKKGVKSAARKK